VVSARANVLSRPEEALLSRSRADSARDALHRRYADKLVVNPSMSRAVVSFQGNKELPFYRWFKFKEAFSATFVELVLDMFQPSGVSTPTMLDPFAGAGTALTTAADAGWQATGIELLPVGVAATRARLISRHVNPDSFASALQRLHSFPLDETTAGEYRFPHLRITRKAFPSETEDALSAYHGFLGTIEDENVRHLFWFACLSALEDASYTRKDGQYLRWDARSGKSLGSRFRKPRIHPLKLVILHRLSAMLSDIAGHNGDSISGQVQVIAGSCLEELPRIPSACFDLVVTSPPYCNRYDYTRTYALELAYMGYGDADVKQLRQALLSATVENKSKRERLGHSYELMERTGWYSTAVRHLESQSALHEFLSFLREAQDRGALNNSNIPTMVANYFFELNIVIHELARILRTGGRTVMVNDNVQYHGEELPVDLILSDLATKAGLSVEAIWVLPKGKGNSSQQMGRHGRNELRKCVYIWTKERGIDQ